MIYILTLYICVCVCIFNKLTFIRGIPNRNEYNESRHRNA